MHVIDRLLELMIALRDPRGGCPWDVAQDFGTIAPYTIEEAYEVADAIEREDWDALRDELGDLLFQVVFHARMAEEAGRFSFADVVRGVVDKMRRRHPHVFGGPRVASAEAQTLSWERIKAEERAREGGAGDGALDGVPRGAPALQRAAKLQRRAAGVGFDWGDAAAVLPKVTEEAGEIGMALAASGPRSEEVREEVGDLLFTCVNLARHLGVDPETALVGANVKFERRFRAMEAAARREGVAFSALDAAGLEARWEQAKRDQRGDGPGGA